MHRLFSQFKGDDLAEAEDKLQRLRQMLNELRAAIRDTEELLEAAERRKE